MHPNLPHLRFSGLFLPMALILASLPAADAVNPLDNDGGSGHDAGDLPADAVPIQPGQVQGRIAPPVDARDYYRFDAAAATVVRLTYSAAVGALYLRSHDGATYGVVPPARTVQLVVPKAGPWFLLVDVHQNPFNYAAGPTNYEFTFAAETRPHVAIIDSPSKWHVVEAQWGRTREIAYSAWVNPNIDALNFEPTAALFALNHRFVHDNDVQEPVFADQIYRTAASGERVVAGPVGPYEAPSTPPAVDAAADELSQPLFGGADACSDCSGTLRVRMAATGARTWIIAIASTDTFEVRNASGSDLVLWSERDAQGTTQIRVPGLAADTQRETAFAVSDGFLGSFLPYRAKASVTRPDNRTSALDCTLPEANVCQTADFLGPLGTWTIRMEPRVAAGAGSDMYYLFGAQFPSLGLWDSSVVSAGPSEPPPTSQAMPSSPAPPDQSTAPPRSPSRYVRVEASPAAEPLAALVGLGCAVALRRPL